MNGTSMNDDRASTARLTVELRVILTTARAGLRQVTEPHKQALVRARAQELLGELEQRVLLDGSDPQLLAAIRSGRGELIG